MDMSRFKDGRVHFINVGVKGLNHFRPLLLIGQKGCVHNDCFIFEKNSILHGIQTGTFN